MKELTVEQRIHQNNTKWRIIAQREMRQMIRGEIDVLPAVKPRQINDLVEQTFLAGLRHGAAK